MPSVFFSACTYDDSIDEFLIRYLPVQCAGQQGRFVDVNRMLRMMTQIDLATAAKFAVERGQTDVDAHHILRVMLDQDPAAAGVRQAGADPQTIIDAVDERLPTPEENKGEATASLNASAQKVLLDGYQVARAFGSTYIDPEHVFFAFVLNQESPAGSLLAQAGVTPQSLQAGAQG